MKNMKIILLSILFIFIVIPTFGSVISNSFNDSITAGTGVTLDNGSIILPINKVNDEVNWAPEESKIMSPASGEAWLSGYRYRQQCTITGSSGADINYQISITVYNSTGSSSGAACYIDTVSNRGGTLNFADVRWTDNDGSTELDYWMSLLSSTAATFWIEVRDDLDTNQVIYIYYGKASDTTTSNGTNTFIFFDNFETNNLNAWTVAGDNWHTDSSITKPTNTISTYYGHGDADATGRILNKSMTINYGIAIDAWVRIEDITGIKFPFIGYSKSDGMPAYMAAVNTNDVGMNNGSYYYYSLNSILADTWYQFEVAWDRPNSLFKFRLNWGTATSLQSDWGNGTNVDTIYHQTSVTSDASGRDHFIDDYCIRKYILTEPAPATWTAQEDDNPTNDVAPVCDNLDDTDNLYAQYRGYTFDTSSVDGAGFANIHTVDLYCIDGADATYWQVRYHEDDNVFSEIAGGTYIELSVSENSYTKSGVNLDLTFNIRIEWAHGNVSDYDLKQITTDSGSLSDTDSYASINYDYETRLDLLSGSFVNDGVGTSDRGTCNDDFTISDTLVYFGSTTCFAPSDEIDAWASANKYAASPPSAIGPWSDLIFSSGVFSMTAYADDVVDGTDTTYTVIAVLEGAGSGGTNELHAAHTDLYSPDKVIIYFDIADTHVNLGTNITCTVKGYYLYDNATFDGTINFNQTDWNGPASSEDYGFTVNTISEDTHGVTIFTGNKVVKVIWDRVDIYFDIVDTYVNLGVNITCTVKGYFEYNNATFDGTITFNQTDWNGPASSEDYGFTVASISGGTGGITLIDRNEIIEVVWDRVDIYFDIVDTRVDLGTNITCTVKGYFEYNNATFDGTITFNQTDWNGPSSAEDYGFTVASISGGTGGITLIDRNEIIEVIWDRVVAAQILINDRWVNIGTSVQVSIWMIYDYDDTNVEDGDFTINSIDADYGGIGVWHIHQSSATPAMIDYYNTVVVTESNTYGITVVGYTVWSGEVVWDSVTITMTDPTDQRQNINSNATGIVITITMDYNGTAYGGTAMMNNTDYNGDGTATRWGYTVLSVSGGTKGITTIATNDETYMIWDSLTITITGPTDNRQNLDVNASGIIVSIIYNYDSSAYDGTCDLNNTDFNGDGTVVRWGYTVDHVNGDDTYGITTIVSNDDTYMIWDAIEIYADGCDYTDIYGRVNVGQNVTIWASARLQYDNHILGSGDYIVVDDKTMTWNGTHFVHGYVEWSVGLFVYTINATLNYEDTYDITIGINTPVNLIFDRVKIYDMWITDDYVSLGDPVTIYVSLVSEYDNESMIAGLVQLNGTLGIESAGNINMTYVSLSNWNNITTIPTFGNWTFIITWVNWTTYNLTEINYNNWNITYLSTVADRIIVMGYNGNTTDYRDNIGTYLNLTVWLQYEFDNTNVTDGNVWGNGQILALQNLIGTGNWTALFMNSTASDATWNLITTSGNTRGIETVNQNGESLSYIWDSYIVSFTVVDNRIDISTNASVTYTVLSTYDNIAYDGTVNLNYTTWTQNVVIKKFFTVSSLSGDDTYGITSISTNDIDYVIWDRVLVYSMGTSDNRIDINVASNAYMALYYEFDSVGCTDGTYTVNGIATWRVTASQYAWTETYATVQRRDYDTVVSFGDNAYGITVVNQNGQSVYIIWDRVQVQSYTVVDQWVNINDNVNIDFLLYYDYDDSSVTDGSVTLNTYTAAHQGAGTWRIIRTSVIPAAITYSVVTATGNVYGITVVDTNSKFIQVVWDSVHIHITPPTDNRQNINSNASGIIITITMDYNATIYGGTATMNNTDYNGSGSPIKWYYTVASVSGGTYGITTISSNEIVYMIWDQIKVKGYGSNSTDDRDNEGTYVIISTWLQYDYDDTNMTDGTVLVNGQSYSYLSGGNWSATFMNATVSDATWNSVVVSGNLYGITDVNQNSQYITYIWDKVAVTMATNMTWTIVTYYVNISYTGIYQYDSTSWDGFATVVNTGMLITDADHWEGVTKSLYTNTSFYVSAIDNDVYDITAFVSNTIWCVWDNITATEYYYVTDMSSTTKLFNIFFENITWAYNGSLVPINWVMKNYRNDTYVSSATTDGAGWLSPSLQIIPVDSTWLGIDYINNATKTINGRAYNFQWYEVKTATATEMSIQVENVAVLSDTIVASGSTNVDFTWNIYNEGITSGETGTITSANDFKITFNKITTYGMHNYSIYFDAGASGNRWFNGTYTNTFDISIEIPEEKGDSIEIKGKSNVDCDWYVYNSDTSTWTGEDGVITGGDNYFQFLFDKLASEGLHNYSLYFNVSSTVYVWKNGTYYVSPIVFMVSDTLFLYSTTSFLFSGYVNLACDWYLYNIDVLMNSGTFAAGSFSQSWNAAWFDGGLTGIQLVNLKFVNGATIRWVNGSYYVTPIVLQITDTNFMYADIMCTLNGYANLAPTYSVYQDDGLLLGPTLLASGSFSISWYSDVNVGIHTFSAKFTNGATSVWVNGSYYTALVSFIISDTLFTYTTALCTLSGAANFDLTYTIYTNNTLESGPTALSAGSFSITWLSQTVEGLHCFGAKFVYSSVERWVNGSYYVSTVYGLCTITLYDGQSNVFIDNAYKLYINGTREPSMEFYNRTDYVYNITFTDYFGYTVHSAIYDYARFIDIQLAVYTFKVYSEVSTEYLYFNLTRSGGATYSEHIKPGGELVYRLIAATYQYDFKKINGPNYDFYTGSLILTADTSYIISDISITELYAAVQRNVGGGGNSQVMSALAQTNNSIGMLQTSMWILAGIIIIAMVYTGATKKERVIVNPDGSITKKKQPWQLKKHSFKSGKANPNYTGSKNVDADELMRKYGFVPRPKKSEK